MKSCSIEDCDTPRHSRGLCPKHYQRLRKYGDVNHVESRAVPRLPVPVCAYDGCDEKVSRRARAGMCEEHTPPRKPPKPRTRPPAKKHDRQCPQCKVVYDVWPGHSKNVNCGQECRLDAEYAESAKRLTRNSTLASHSVKRYLFRYGHAERKCLLCGLDEWMGKPMPLTLDHINGVHNDNRLENLRILCANCHSQTDTFCGKNKGNKQAHMV